MEHGPPASGDDSDDESGVAEVVAHAPGRVNLIGDHTDYTGGLVLPMAIGLGTTVRGLRGGAVVRLASDDREADAVVPLDVAEPGAVDPPWARYVAGVVAEVRPTVGFSGTVTTTVPIGAGLSSSAALELSVALALGFEGSAIDLALLGQRAEHRATGVPTGILDQLTSAAGVEGQALMIDCHSLDITPVVLPPDVEVVVIHSGEERSLDNSAYADRVAECERAEAAIGPLRLAAPGDVDAIADDVVRARARHVVTENQRVRDFAGALAGGRLDVAGRLMVRSHRSLSVDYEVSTPGVDALVDRLTATDGVFGARMSGGGFGGVVVALTEPDALAGEGWHVRPARGARVL